MTYWVPDTYISAGVPSRVMADIKLATKDRVMGKVLMDLLAIRISSVFFCPFHQKKTPMADELKLDQKCLNCSSDVEHNIKLFKIACLAY